MNEKLRTLFMKYKTYWYAPVLVVFGIALMTLQFEQPQAAKTAAYTMSNTSYIEETETRLEEMLKGINDVGNCEVTITLASGGKKEYVREEGQVLVITDKDGNQSAVLSKESAPEIAGVTIICSNNMNINVKKDIINSVGTVLGIGTNKICVVFLNGE